MEIKRTLLAITACACFGLGTTFAQEATSVPDNSSVAPSNTTPEVTSAQITATANPSSPKVSALTPMMKNLINVIFWAKTIDDFKNPESAVHVEVDARYPEAIFEEIKPLDTAFDTNEVRANRKYKGKWLWVVGTVGKISDSEEKGPSMVVNEPEDHQSIKAYFTDSEKARDRLENLAPGQLTSLMCQVSGLVQDVVTMKNCEFFDPLELNTYLALRTQFFEALEAKGDLIKNAPVAFILLAGEDAMPNDLKNACAKSEISCILAMTKHPKISEPDMDRVLKQFESLGYT
ncbi:MAG: OB-fold putative lipoprotein, partial [Burkholderiales bacterium]|nr:OB-fold putative lipoprotein [Burkholderiales bacterium]